MTRALGCAAAALVLGSCCAYALSVLPGRERVRGGILRARWAWRCRGHPARPDDGELLDRDEMRAFLGLVECWRHDTAPAERSRT